jgi:hypothetical protein
MLWISLKDRILLICGTFPEITSWPTPFRPVGAPAAYHDIDSLLPLQGAEATYQRGREDGD